ncbi:hypothetical protein ACQUY5_26835 [Bacillus cereus]|uniref:hypothetical protein n=1 Tax=Bacillus cereus TaxID=1396 RepID=UPI003D16D816
MEINLAIQIIVCVVQLMIVLHTFHSLFVKDKTKLDKIAWTFPLGSLFVCSLLSFMGDRLGLSVNLLDTLGASIASNECLLFYFVGAWASDRYQKNTIIYPKWLRFGSIGFKYITLGLGVLLTLVAIADLILYVIA